MVNDREGGGDSSLYVEDSKFCVDWVFRSRFDSKRVLKLRNLVILGVPAYFVSNFIVNRSKVETGKHEGTLPA